MMDGVTRSLANSPAVVPSVSVINISGSQQDAGRLGWLMSGARDPGSAASVAAVLGLSPAAAAAALHGAQMSPVGPVMHAGRPLTPGAVYGRSQTTPVSTLSSPPPAHSNRRECGPPMLRPLSAPSLSPVLINRQQQQRLLEAELRQLAELEASEMASFEAAEAEQEERGRQSTLQVFHGIQLPPELQITVVAPASSRKQSTPLASTPCQSAPPPSSRSIGRRPPPQLTPITTAPELVRTAGVWRPIDAPSARHPLVPTMANRSRTPLTEPVSVPLYRGSAEVSVTVLPSADTPPHHHRHPLPRPLQQPPAQSAAFPPPPQHPPAAPVSLSALLAAPTVIAKPTYGNMAPPISRNMATPISRNMATPIPRNMATPISRNMAPPISRNMATPISRNMAPPISMNMATPISRNMETPIGLATPSSRNMTTHTVLAPTSRNLVTPTGLPAQIAINLAATSGFSTPTPVLTTHCSRNITTPTLLTTPIPRNMAVSSVSTASIPRNMIAPPALTKTISRNMTLPIARHVATPTILPPPTSMHMVTPTVLATPILRPATTHTIVSTALPGPVVSTTFTPTRLLHSPAVRPMSSLSERQSSVATVPLLMRQNSHTNPMVVAQSRPCLPTPVLSVPDTKLPIECAVSDSLTTSVHPLLGSLVRKVTTPTAVAATPVVQAVGVRPATSCSVSPPVSPSAAVTLPFPGNPAITSTAMTPGREDFTPVSPSDESQSVSASRRRREKSQQSQLVRRRSDESLQAGCDGNPPSPSAVSPAINGTLPKIPTLRITKNKTGDEYSVQTAASEMSPQAGPTTKSADLFYTFDVDESVGIRQLGEDQRPRYVCDICNAVYQRLHSLKRHRYRTHINHRYVHHSDMASAELTALSDTSQFDRMTPLQPHSRYPFLYCCYPCRQLFDTLPAVVSHQHGVHGAAPTPSESGPRGRWPCDRCDEAFSSRRELDKHAEVHAECQSFACKFCDQVFPCESVKKRHEKIHGRDGGRSGGVGSGGALNSGGCGGQQAIAKINIGGVKISVGIGNLQQLKKFQEACREMSETSNGTISLESADLDVLEQLEERPRAVFPCALCHKSFPTYKRMCCHMRMAHPQRAVPSKASCYQQGGSVSTGDEQLEQERNMAERRFYAAVSQNVTDNLNRHLDGTLSSISAKCSDGDGSGVDVKPVMSVSDEGSGGGDCDWGRVDLHLHHIDMASQARRQASLTRGHHFQSNHTSQHPAELPTLLGLRPSQCVSSPSPGRRCWWLPPEPGAAAKFSEAARGQQHSSSESPPTAPAAAAVQVSGEWPLATTLLCHACGATFSTATHLHDHQQQRHPHVVCDHTRLSGPAAPPARALGPAAPAVRAAGAGCTGGQCSRCDRVCVGQAELHRHVLECGGDLDWNQWASSVASPRKRRWRAFGARRRRRLAPPLGSVRRQLGSAESGGAGVRRRRDKTTRSKYSRDTASDSIEKMLANLPAKRVSKQLFPVLNLVQLQRRQKQQQQRQQQESGPARPVSRAVSPSIDPMSEEEAQTETPGSEQEEEPKSDEDGDVDSVPGSSPPPSLETSRLQRDQSVGSGRTGGERCGKRGRRLVRASRDDATGLVMRRRRGRPISTRGRPRGRPPISRLIRDSEKTSSSQQPLFTYASSAGESSQAKGVKRSLSASSRHSDEARPSRLRDSAATGDEDRQSPTVRPSRKRLSRASRPSEEPADPSSPPAIPPNSMFSVSITTNRTRTAYTCTKCCQKLYRLATLQRHLQKCCDQPDFSLQSLLPAELTERQCVECGHGFLSSAHLALHVAACHRHTASPTPTPTEAAHTAEPQPEHCSTTTSHQQQQIDQYSHSHVSDKHAATSEEFTRGSDTNADTKSSVNKSMAIEAKPSSIATGDKSPGTSESDKSPGTAESDKLPDGSESDKSPDTSESNQSPGTSESDKSPGTAESNQSPGTSESNKSPGTAESNKSPGTSESDKSPGTAESDKLPDTSESDKSPSIAESNKSPGTRENDKSPSIAERDKSLGTAESDKSPGTAESDESLGALRGDNSASNATGDKSPDAGGNKSLVFSECDNLSTASVKVELPGGVSDESLAVVESGVVGDIGSLPALDQSDADRVVRADSADVGCNSADVGCSSAHSVNPPADQVVCREDSVPSPSDRVSGDDASLVSSSTDCQLGEWRCARCQRPFLSRRRLSRHRHSALCSADWRDGRDDVTQREALFSLLHAVRRELDSTEHPGTSHHQHDHQQQQQQQSLLADTEQQNLLTSIADKLSHCTAEHAESTQGDRSRMLRSRLCERVQAVSCVGSSGSEGDSCPPSDNIDSVLLGLYQLVANDDVLRFLREAPSRSRRHTQLVAGLGSVGRGCTARQWAAESAGLRAPRRPPHLLTHGRQRPNSVIENMRCSFNAGQTVTMTDRTEQRVNQSPPDLSVEPPASTGQLGVIASAVNCVLDGASQETVGIHSLSPTPSVPHIDPDVQHAMGITDEQLQILEQLGSSRQPEPADGSVASGPPAGPPVGVTSQLVDEEKRAEYECFICDRRYCGREALTQHLLQQHRASRDKVLTRTSQLSASQVLSESECVERCCFVCGELMSDSLQLNLHISQLHIRRSDQQQPEQQPSVAAAGCTDTTNQLRRQMSSALGGLFDKAICSMKKRQHTDKSCVVSTSSLSPVTASGSSSDGCRDKLLSGENGSPAGVEVAAADPALANDNNFTAPVVILCPLCYEPVSLHSSSVCLRDHLASRHQQLLLQFSACDGRQAHFICSASGQPAPFLRPLIQAAGGRAEPVTCTAVSSTQLSEHSSAAHSGFICSGCGVCFDDSSEANSHDHCVDGQPPRSTSGVCVDESVVECLHRQLSVDVSCYKPHHHQSQTSEDRCLLET